MLSYKLLISSELPYDGCLLFSGVPASAGFVGRNRHHIVWKNISSVYGEFFCRDRSYPKNNINEVKNLAFNHKRINFAQQIDTYLNEY